MDPATDLALAARAGDREAFAALVRCTQADVWRYCAHLGGRAVADDLAQETYLRAVRAVRRYEGRAPARTWLLAIARRVCADHLRAATRRRRLGPVEPRSVRDVARPGDHAAQVALEHLLATLSEERRAAFVLTQVLGLAYGEAADVCGCPVGTIRSRVARAREDLVAALARDAGSA